MNDLYGLIVTSGGVIVIFFIRVVNRTTGKLRKQSVSHLSVFTKTHFIISISEFCQVDFSLSLTLAAKKKLAKY